MTETRIHRPAEDRSHPTSSAARRERRLRLVLRANAASSAASGLVLTFAPNAMADLLDVGRPGWVRLVGLALLPFAGFVAWLSIADVAQLRLHTPGVVVGDVGWVVASVVTIALGWYAGVGIALVVAMAALVDVFAVLQWRAWSALRD